MAAGHGAWTGPTVAVAVGVWGLVAWRMHHTVSDVAGTTLVGALILMVVGIAGVRDDVRDPSSRSDVSPPVPDAA